MSAFELQFDVVVVGAGGAGVMAALAAGDSGADVLLLEKDSRRRSNSELSGGLVQGANTRFQQAVGVEDSPERMLSDIMTKNGGGADRDVVFAVCMRSRDVIDYFTDTVGLPIELDTVPYYNHTALRLHKTPTESGAEIMSYLRAAVRKHPRITFIDKMPATGLIVTDDAVVGLTNGLGERIGCRSVVLACDGFGGNQEMVRRYCPEMAGAQYIGSENNVGDGIAWGIEAGAAVDRMAAYQGHSHVNPKHGTRLGGAMFSAGSLVLNREGRRFEREDQGYSEFARVVLAQPGGVGVEVFDQRIFDIAWGAASFREAHSVGAVARAETLSELAEAFQLPASTVEWEVKDYNRAATSGSDRFGREAFGPPLAPPYYGSLVTGALVHTQGGLRIDPTCRVLREDGTAISGLLAAGGTAAGISGSGPEGYMSGNGLIQAFATGLIAGETAAAGRGQAIASAPDDAHVG